MAKKKKIEKHTHTTSVKKKVDTTPKWAVPLMLILTFAAYIPALSAGFVNWDDADYANGNVLIRDLSNISALMTTPVQGNYHPLTMISLAINYSISGLDAWSYHLFNLLFHLVNCWLVFRFARLLSKQNFIIAFTTAILFAIHPMHVESVAWVSERKDVLYSMFFIAGLISYLKYVDTNSKKQFVLSLLFLVLSLLSKPAAVVFPLVLFCIDLLRRRPLTLKLFIEKIPFMIPVLIMGLLTFYAQADVGATGSAPFNMITRIFFGFYGIMMYLVKLFFPYHLSPFYPYPPINESLPVEYLISPVVFIALVTLFYFSMKKNRVIAFGISFFLANLVLVLQILPVGSAVIAERYTYISYIGIFYILGSLINQLSSFKQTKALYIIIPVSILFSILTYRESGIWHDSTSLWEHVIATNPNSKAYTLRASQLRKENQLEKALEYYNKAISMNVIDQESYVNRGNIYLDMKKYDLALADYRRSLSIKPDFYVALDNLGTMFAMQGNYDSALLYLNKATQINPDYKPPYSNRALTYMQLKRYDEAIKDFEKYLSLDPNDADVINTIGYCLRSQNKFQEAIVQINKAIALNPLPNFYLNRSYAYYGLNDPEQAKRDALKAREGGAQLDASYVKILGL